MEIKSRLPGNIVEIAVKEGDAVKARQVIGKLEAMKMEQPILSPVDGTVKEVKVAVNDKVKSGQVLFVVE